MSHNFKVGDRVVIVKSIIPSRIGQIANITGFDIFKSFGNWGTCPDAQPGLPCVDLDLEPLLSTTNTVAYPPSYLEPYLNDGSEKGEWTPELINLCNYNSAHLDISIYNSMKKSLRNV